MTLSITLSSLEEGQDKNVLNKQVLLSQAKSSTPSPHFFKKMVKQKGGSLNSPPPFFPPSQSTLANSRRQKEVGVGGGKRPLSPKGENYQCYVP